MSHKRLAFDKQVVYDAFRLTESPEMEATTPLAYHQLIKQTKENIMSNRTETLVFKDLTELANHVRKSENCSSATDIDKINVKFANNGITAHIYRFEEEVFLSNLEESEIVKLLGDGSSLTLTKEDTKTLDNLIKRMQTDRVMCFQMLEKFGVVVKDNPEGLVLHKPD